MTDDLERRGRFIAFEGGEGSGKSTQAARLASELGAVLTREPGGTSAGAAIRALLLDPETGDLDDRAEALLMAADRAQHIAHVVRPALVSGRDVVTDRSAHSSLAYQGYGRGLPLDAVRHLSTWATDDLWPDLVILLDIAPAVATARIERSRDRIESADDGFHSRVLAGFRALAAADPQRWVVIDGAQDEARVAAAVDAAIMSRWA